METYEVNWTNRAKKDLRKIYDFYNDLVGEVKSFEMISKLLQRVDLLTQEKFVRMGAIDEEFKHLKKEYKKLIEGDIKITYRISETKPMVYINRVFNTRQHPSKNK